MRVDLLIPIDRTLAEPLRDQLYQGMRDAIVDGRVAAGARLPATRALAAQLGVSRFTVDDAYGRLISEGYVAGRRGSGTFVGIDAVASLRSIHRPADPTELVEQRRLSGWGERTRRTVTETIPAPALEFNFRHGAPSLSEFPFGVWRRCVIDALMSIGETMHGYGHPAGYFPLRQALAGYLSRARMLACTAEQIVVTSGTQQALDLLTRLFIEPGDAVAIEDPTYPAARRVFESSGAELRHIPVDDDGMRIDRLTVANGAPRLLYVTPAHQFPTGGVLPLSRRLQLLQWARRERTIVIEDDYDGEFRYGQRPVEALAALSGAFDPGSMVVYLGTFSKVLYPSLRLGYMVLPSDLVDAAIAAKAITDRHDSTVEQAALTAFIAGGHFERHLSRMRKLYANRQRALIAALDRHLGGIARRDTASTAAGLHLLVNFAVPYAENELLRRAEEAGLRFDGGADFFSTRPATPHALLGYAAEPEERIDEGMRRLARVL